MAEFIYVDNSNLFIAGKRVHKIAKSTKLSNRPDDESFAIDFGSLYNFLTGGDESNVKSCCLFGSVPPKDDTIWNIARKNGFEVTTEERNIANKEKKIDSGIVARMMRDAYKLADPEEDTITIVSGDGDYVPAVLQLIADGYKNVECASWNHAASRELQNAVTRFISLDEHLEFLSYIKKS